MINQALELKNVLQDYFNSFILVCLLILTIVDCQTLVYYCNFDVGLIDDCAFDESITGVSTLTTVSGVIPTHLKPTEPLSDVTSIRKKLLVKNI
jgi:hypothetical protein